LRSLVGLLFPCFGACFGNGGTPLDKMPPSQVSVIANVTGSAVSTLTLEIIAKDLSLCPKIASDVAASVNGRALSLSDSGGTRQRKGGESYCGYPRYEGSGLAQTGTTSIRLSDSTATYTIDAPGALQPAQLKLVVPADGLLHPGQTGKLTITAASLSSVYYGSVGFSLSSEPGTTVFAAESSSSTMPLTVSGADMTFTVPGGLTKTGPGTFNVAVTILDNVTTCNGPAECAVKTGFLFAVPATLANP
jgi:hypothetical protein